jgi:hypothetical protein
MCPPVEACEHPADQAFRVTFPGPFQHHDVVVNGWRVPFLEAQLSGEDRIVVTLDRRFSVQMGTEEAERMLPFIANAVAVALGYGSHPRAESEPPLERVPYPRPVRMTEIAGMGDPA